MQSLTIIKFKNACNFTVAGVFLYAFLYDNRLIDRLLLFFIVVCANFFAFFCFATAVKNIFEFAKNLQKYYIDQTVIFAKKW